MFQAIRVVIGATMTAVLVGCAGLPTPMPSQSPAPLKACPAYATGPAPLTFRFPQSCEGMRQTSTGVRIIPIQMGAEDQGQPGVDATVVVNYEGFLAATGARIDSSYERGEAGVFQVSELIPGWGEALQLMRPGDEWVIHIPAELAYGDAPLGELIPAGSDLIFRLNLEGFLEADELQSLSAQKRASLEAGAFGPDMQAWQTYFPWDETHPERVELDSGVSYIRLEIAQERGDAAKLTDQVLVHYEGRLADTSRYFDSSWERGEPTLFEVAAVVPGFAEVLTEMAPGDRILAHIPAEFAYGETGIEDLIPANADLLFQIQLLEIIPTE